MRLHLLSDLHLEFAPFEPRTPPSRAADVVVLAGDIAEGVAGIEWARRSFPQQEIVYVSGNHELYGGDWNDSPHQLRRVAFETGVHFLERDGISLRGVRFLGATLWTDFRYFGESHEAMYMSVCEEYVPDFKFIGVRTNGKRTKLTPARVQARHAATLAWLRDELEKPGVGPTVVVTHHLPHALSVAKPYARDPLTPAFASRLPESLITKADLWLHGHTHRSCNYVLHGTSGRKTRVLCNPRGYPAKRHQTSGETPDFNAELLIQI